MMPRLLLILAALIAIYTCGEVYLTYHVDWMGWFHPRGGIVGFAWYVLFASGLILAGRSDMWKPSTRAQLTTGGWLLMLLPPLYFLLRLP